MTFFHIVSSRCLRISSTLNKFISICNKFHMQIKIRPTVHIEKKKHHTVESIDLTWVAGLLRGVQNGRSLQSAADAMEMSYRTLWNRLKAAEKALDCRLMMSVKGHGSSLTAAAKTFLQQF